MKVNPDRRNFIKLALAGTIGSKFLFSDSMMIKESMLINDSLEDVSKLKLPALLKQVKEKKRKAIVLKPSHTTAFTLRMNSGKIMNISLSR